jgi:hypothetical protein
MGDCVFGTRIYGYADLFLMSCRLGILHHFVPTNVGFRD